MSVDFYVAVPAGQWPTAVAVEQYASREGYPIKVKRFPALNAKIVTTDGGMVTVDGSDAYLERFPPDGSRRGIHTGAPI